MESALAVIVESRGKARAFKRALPEATLVVTGGSLFDLAWDSPVLTRGGVRLRWRRRRPFRKEKLRNAKVVVLALDPDEEGELQARLLQKYHPHLPFIRVHVWSLDEHEVREVCFSGKRADRDLSERLYRTGLARRVYDRALALFFASRGLAGYGRSQAGILHLLARELFLVRYVHSFFAAGEISCLTVLSSATPETLVVKRAERTLATLPPATTARILARAGRRAMRHLESLYLKGAISYPRVSPESWNALPPPITALPEARVAPGEEARVFQIVRAAGELKEVQAFRLATEEDWELTALPEEYFRKAPDLFVGYAAFTGKPHLWDVRPGDVLRRASSERLDRKPLAWLFPEVDEGGVARPAYLEEVLEKLARKGLISFSDDHVELTEEGRRVQERLEEALPELADPDFGRLFYKKLREGPLYGDPEAPTGDPEFLEVTASLIEEASHERDLSEPQNAV